MSEYIQEITFEQARKLAEEVAIKQIWLFRESNEVPVLNGHYEEGECCWFFFRNREIQIPEHMILRDGAYAISKRGEIRLIVDFSYDSKLLKEYLQKFSEHLKELNE